MYNDILNLIDQTINEYEKDTSLPTEEKKHYFIQGLLLAKQLIEHVQDVNTNECAYEKFEEVVKLLRQTLYKEEMLGIVNNSYAD